MKAKITNIDSYGLVTINFTSNLKNEMFFVKEKMDRLMEQFSKSHKARAHH